MKKSFKDFIKEKYKNCTFSANLNSPIVAKLDIVNLFKEDILEYEKYLQSIEEVKTIPNYSL